MPQKVTVDELTIDGTVYVPKTTTQNFKGPIKIVVLQRGWVFIGRYSEKGDLRILNNAYGIQTWGTTKGLPELVNGATSSTKLNKCDGEISFHKLSELFTIDVNESSWKQI